MSRRGSQCNERAACDHSAVPLEFHVEMGVFVVHFVPLLQSRMCSLTLQSCYQTTPEPESIVHTQAYLPIDVVGLSILTLSRSVIAIPYCTKSSHIVRLKVGDVEEIHSVAKCLGPRGETVWRRAWSADLSHLIKPSPAILYFLPSPQIRLSLFCVATCSLHHYTLIT